MYLDLSSRALWARILAVDETSHEYFATREDAPGAILFTSDQSPAFNLALITRTTAADAGPVLESIIDHYSRVGRDTRVRLTPLSEPGDWPQRLAQRGFVPLEAEDELFMALPAASGVTATGAGQPAGPSVTVRRVSTDVGAEDEAEVFTRVQRAGFGEPLEGLPEAIQATRRSLAVGRYRFYVAYLGDEAAGAASARMVRDALGGVAGLYGLTTLPHVRRRGVGAALVRYLVNEATAEGLDVVFLSAEPGSPGAGLYERLGFAPTFSVRNYLLRQPAASKEMPS
jgi:ribosomal protein S18 acetylase RimI-like enzyme